MAAIIPDFMMRNIAKAEQDLNEYVRRKRELFNEYQRKSEAELRVICGPEPVEPTSLEKTVALAVLEQRKATE